MVAFRPKLGHSVVLPMIPKADTISECLMNRSAMVIAGGTGWLPDGDPARCSQVSVSLSAFWSSGWDDGCRPLADVAYAWQSDPMRLIEEVVSASEKRKLRLFERDDGRFWFEEIYEDFGEDAGLYWTPGYQSGLFVDAALARTEMHAITPWLRR